MLTLHCYQKSYFNESFNINYLIDIMNELIQMLRGELKLYENDMMM